MTVTPDEQRLARLLHDAAPYPRRPLTAADILTRADSADRAEPLTSVTEYRGGRRWRPALLAVAAAAAVAGLAVAITALDHAGGGNTGRPPAAPAAAHTASGVSSGPASDASGSQTVVKGSQAIGPTDAATRASAQRLTDLNRMYDAVEAHPDQYAGWNTDGDTRVWIYPVAGAQPDPDVTAAVAALRADGATVTFETRQVSLRTLQQVMAAIPTDPSFAQYGAQLTDWGIDMAAGKVGVGAIPPSDALAAALNARHGGLVSLHQGRLTISSVTDHRPTERVPTSGETASPQPAGVFVMQSLPNSAADRSWTPTGRRQLRMRGVCGILFP